MQKLQDQIAIEKNYSIPQIKVLAFISFPTFWTPVFEPLQHRPGILIYGLHLKQAYNWRGRLFEEY